MVLSAAGAATSYVGSQKAADAAEDAGRAQRDAAAQAARNEELQTAENIRRERDKKARDLARIRATLGGSGLTMEGSIEDAFTEAAGRMEVAIQDKARAGAMDAQNLRNQGDMALWEARNEALGTRISSYGTLLSSAGAMAGKSSRGF